MKKFVIALMLATACTMSATSVYAATLQDVAANSPMPITLQTSARAWQYLDVGTTVYASAVNNNATMSATVEGACRVSFRSYVQKTTTTVKAYLDDELVASCNSTSWTDYTIDVPSGTHTIKWVLISTHSNVTGFVRSIEAVQYGDCNADGNIDILDAITLLNMDYSTAPSYCDMNEDKNVSKEDVACILRKLSNLEV
jgi:hypothetical protein